MKAFLTRGFYIRTEDRCSAKLDVTSGAAQGSVVGPLVFLLFTDDLALALKSPSFFFADELKVVGSIGREDLRSNIGFVLD